MIEKVKHLEQKVAKIVARVDSLRGERRELKDQVAFLMRQLDQLKEQLHRERESSADSAAPVLPVEVAEELRRAANELRGQ